MCSKEHRHDTKSIAPSAAVKSNPSFNKDQYSNLKNPARAEIQLITMTDVLYQ
jgi:hypothetical protein